MQRNLKTGEVVPWLVAGELQNSYDGLTDEQQVARLVMAIINSRSDDSPRGARLSIRQAWTALENTDCIQREGPGAREVLICLRLLQELVSCAATNPAPRDSAMAMVIADDLGVERGAIRKAIGIAESRDGVAKDVSAKQLSERLTDARRLLAAEEQPRETPAVVVKALRAAAKAFEDSILESCNEIEIARRRREIADLEARAREIRAALDT